ncbi:MAG: hypothetical protein H7Y88_11045, partial [Phycisphaerales bacterium]|nr:hypothetical protein [Phycisphaerales bacterium]
AEVVALVRRAGAFDTEGRLASLRTEGTIRLVHMGVTGKESSLAAADGRYRSDVDLGAFGRMATIAGLEKGRSDSGFARNYELIGEKLEEARLQSPLFWARDWEKAFETITVVGAEEHKGEPVYVLRMSRRGTPDVLIRISKATGLPAAIEFTQSTIGSGPLQVVYRLSDYREVNGVKLAHRTEIQFPMMGTIVSQWERAEANPALDAAAFE